MNKTKLANVVLRTLATLGILLMLSMLVWTFLHSWVAGLVVLGVPALLLLLAWALDNHDFKR